MQTTQTYLRTGKLSSLEALIHFHSQSQYVFFSEQFAALTGRVPGSLANKAALNRMAVAGRITCLRKQPSTWLLMPLDEPGQGAPDKVRWLHQFLEQEDSTCYLGLLSAARHWGATQCPATVEHVLGARIKRGLSVPGLTIQFFHKRDAANTPTLQLPESEGSFRVSTPEATVLDLIRHMDDIGGSERLILAFCELAVHLTSEGWAEALQASNNVACAQRAGFLLAQLGFETLAGLTHQWIGGRRTNTIVFSPKTLCATPYLNERFRVRYGELEKEIVGV